VECPAGKTSTGSHDASGGNTTCEATKCGANEKVAAHVCVECPAGKTSTGSHDASGGDTTCETTMCGENEKVVNHVCVECPAGKTSTGNHDASGNDTTCEAASCNVTPPANGAMGDCPATLASGSTCQPVCNWNYVVNGSSSCNMGTLTPAFCEEGIPIHTRVQLVPGSRYDHETCACANVTTTIFNDDDYYPLTFEDGLSYEYEYEDLEPCTEASAYIEVTSGSCSGIMSLNECSNAACKLGFSDMTAVPDDRNGATDYPQYCYMEGAFLKFNNGTNTGTCSDDHKCACKAQ